MITAVVMVGEGGNHDGLAADGLLNPSATGLLDMVKEARRAAACDLLEQLLGRPELAQIVVVSPNLAGLALDPSLIHLRSKPGPIHVGRTLAAVAAACQAERLLYFGGGAAPLLDDDRLAEVIAGLVEAERAIFTNNRFASDWAGVAPASILSEWQDRLPQDNMLGWVLSAEAGLPIYAQAATAASRLDIDTPTDLLTLRLHPNTRPHLRRCLAGCPLDTRQIEGLLAVLATPASHVFIAGRIGPEAWQALNRASQCWLRVLAEERGMVSSGRLARGEVYSLLADHLAAAGLEAFFETLAVHSQAALIDTRVMLAHRGPWPAEPDRYASDLGLVEQINDPWLAAFTAAARAAPIPIVLGGHGLLAGDLFAFCEML